MDSESLKTLQILDELSRNGDLTQRALSKKIGVALGLTNLYLKRLVKKGYVKVVNIKPNRLRYELTPKGIAHKTILTLRYLQNSYHFYKEARRRIRDSFQILVEEGCSDVIFYGAGEIAEIAYLSLRETPLRFKGIVDEKRTGEIFYGYPVLHPDSLRGMDFDKLIMTVIDLDREAVLRVVNLAGGPCRVHWIGGFEGV